MNKSTYCHLLEYECLLEVDNLRFALAHVSWPWHDTAIALYGKFLNAMTKRNIRCEMFIDTTPGTPEIYREEVLTKLYRVGYDVADNVMFGTDSSANSYNTKWSLDWQQRDFAILSKFGRA